MIPEMKLTDREWLLLSAYLDGQLSDRERRQVEDLLQTKPASRTALEGLQRTRQVLRYAPVRKLPRNFILSAEQVRKPFLPPFSRILSYSSALAALLLVIVLGVDLFSGASGMGITRTNEFSQQEKFAVLAADEAAQTVSGEAPAIIFWNGVYAPLVGVYGKGGGGGGESATTGYAYGIGGGGGGDGAVIESAPLAEAAPQATEESTAAEEALPSEESGLAVPEMAPEALQAEEQEQAAQEPAAEMDASTAFEDDSPILGVRPLGERGAVRSASGEYVQTRAAQPFSWRLVEIALAVIALLAGLCALVLRKRR